MNGIVKVVQELKPPLLMVLVQVAYAGNTVFASLAISDGMSIRVFSAYRHTFGAAFTFFLAIIFERKNRPKLTWRVLVMTFFCGLFGGSLFQNLFFTALAFVSATYATVIVNMIPVVTFVLSFLCGYEKLNLRSAAGKAKVMGTIIGVSGTMVLSFFKGVEINIWRNIHINLMHKKNNNQVGASHGREWIGVLCGIGCCFSFSAWLIIQVEYKNSKELKNLNQCFQNKPKPHKTLLAKRIFCASSVLALETATTRTHATKEAPTTRDCLKEGVGESGKDMSAIPGAPYEHHMQRWMSSIQLRLCMTVIEKTVKREERAKGGGIGKV